VDYSPRITSRHPLRAFGAFVVLAGAIAAFGFATSPTAAQESSGVIGACHVSPIVADLDRSARFYRDVLGFELTPTQPASPTIAWDTSTALLKVYGTPRAKLRSVVAHLPNERCGIELVEFGGIARTAVHRRIQDHGAIVMILIVRDIDALFGRVAQSRARVITTGGRPIAVGNTRAVTIEDPDGHFIELAQFARTPETTVPESSNVIGIRLRVAVHDTDAAMDFYRNALGLTFQTADFVKNEAVMRMVGLARSGEFRVSTVSIPSSPLLLELMEFRGVPRGVPKSARIQDPGSCHLQLIVADVDATVAALKEARAPIASAGRTPIDMTVAGDRWRLAAGKEPENLFLILQQRLR
jgi:catechol 2,3-dioxygenase-like lactoylglutathione lyase family enzyme